MPPTNTDVDTVTLGEVNRNVSRLFDKVEELTKTVGDYPKWADIHRIEASEAERHDMLAKEVEALKNWQTWAIRCILGALIAGAITALFVFTP